jgi:HD-GYP domain-containing protein (c-di-GMP phosphodiesterase class II)
VTTLATFVAAMAVVDPELGAHAGRVALHAEAIAGRLGWEEEQLEELRLGAALHDVGKVNVPHAVLAKPGRLDAVERAQVQAHPVEGIWLIAGVRSLAPALPYVLFHHERWDGGGYPTRRAGRDIPLAGRVLAVADAFDAMTSSRPYRGPLGVDAALGEVKRCAGTQFDPEVAEAFLEAVRSGDVALAAAS